MPTDFEHTTADLLVRLADRPNDVAQGNAVGQELVRVDHDLVLLHESADGGDLGDARDALQGVAQVPVLQRAELLEVEPPGLVHERVLEHPADAGGVRAQGRRDALGEPPLDLVQVLEHARPGPVHVGAVLEDGVHEGEPEEGLSSDELDPRRGEQRGGDRIGDLVLHGVGALSRPLGEDDHLNVGEIGNGIERAAGQREISPDG